MLWVVVFLWLNEFSVQLEYDVLEYVVIERLAQVGREKLKDDGLNLSDWLQSLASFWGHLYVLFLFRYIVLVRSVCDTLHHICK